MLTCVTVGDDADDKRFCGFEISAECQLIHRTKSSQLSDADETAIENEKVEDEAKEPLEQVTAPPKDHGSACLGTLVS